MTKDQIDVLVATAGHISSHEEVIIALATELKNRLEATVVNDDQARNYEARIDELERENLALSIDASNKFAARSLVTPFVRHADPLLHDRLRYVCIDENNIADFEQVYARIGSTIVWDENKAGAVVDVLEVITAVTNSAEPAEPAAAEVITPAE